MLNKILTKQKKSESKKNGKWKEYNKHAVLIAEGNYRHDLKHGVWKQYYETGELVIEEMYKRGILHGRYTAYHMNGRIMSEGHYVHGSREGYFYIYDEDGNRVKSLLFEKNVEVPCVEKVEVLQASH